MRKWYPVLPIVIMAIVSVMAYPRLPEQVPTHWNWQGQVNAWQSRGQAAVLLPMLALAMWALMRALPFIDPRRANYAKFQPTYDFVIAATLTVIAVIHLAVLGAAAGAPVSIHRVIPIAIGIMLAAIGNQLPRARSNWWFGVRTPWTLSNERVWERTQRVAGYLMIASGIVMIVGAFVSDFVVPLMLVCVAGFVFGSVIYSYFAWRQETSR